MADFLLVDHDQIQTEETGLESLGTEDRVSLVTEQGAPEDITTEGGEELLAEGTVNYFLQENQDRLTLEESGSSQFVLTEESDNLLSEDGGRVIQDGISTETPSTFLHAYIKGTYDDTFIQHAYIRGVSIKQVDNIHAYMRGNDHTFTSQHAYMLGMPKTTLSAYIYGASKARASNVGLSVESVPASKQRLANVVLQFESRSAHRLVLANTALHYEYTVEYKTTQHAYIEGASAFEIEWAQVGLPPYSAWYAQSSQHVYLYGDAEIDASQHAYIYGQANDSTSQHVYMPVGTGVIDSVHAYIAGQVHSSAIQHAMINADRAASTSQHAYMWGQPGTRQPAYIHGGGLARITTVGTEVEWRYPATKRITSVGTSLEYRYPYWLRVTAAGLTIEYVFGSTTILRMSSAGIMVEWAIREDMFGPLVWTI